MTAFDDGRERPPKGEGGDKMPGLENLVPGQINHESLLNLRLEIDCQMGEALLWALGVRIVKGEVPNLALESWSSQAMKFADELIEGTPHREEAFETLTRLCSEINDDAGGIIRVALMRWILNADKDRAPDPRLALKDFFSGEAANFLIELFKTDRLEDMLPGRT